jgi:hypothetical protein
MIGAMYQKENVMLMLGIVLAIINGGILWLGIAFGGDSGNDDGAFFA